MNYEAIWNELKEYVDFKMAKNRSHRGKFDTQNIALWDLKRKMKELDASVTYVGTNFDEHEHSYFDTGKYVNGEYHPEGGNK